MSAIAVARSIGRLTPTMPPYADRGSHSYARRYAPSAASPTAKPHGLVCLITHAAGSSKSATSARAASTSSQLVNDSAAPCSLARVRHPAGPSGNCVQRASLVRVLAVAELVQSRAADGELGGQRLAERAAAQPRGHLACRRRRRARRPRWPAGGASRARPSGARAAHRGPARTVRGETTTATESRFLAAARIIVGPPMSMFSTIVSSSAPLASVSANGYSETTTRSIGS